MCVAGGGQRLPSLGRSLLALRETSELANLNPHKLMVNVLFARHGRSRRPTTFHLDA
jgi:hypothetical protein